MSLRRSEKHLQLTIEERRDIFCAAILIEEKSLLPSRRDVTSIGRDFSESRLSWKDWQIEFFGCVPDGWLNILSAHYMRPISETRNPKGQDMNQAIRSLWREARKKRLIGKGLMIKDEI